MLKEIVLDAFDICNLREYNRVSDEKLKEDLENIDGSYDEERIDEVVDEIELEDLRGIAKKS